MYDIKRAIQYDKWLTDYDGYLDDQYQKQLDDEQQQWEENNEKHSDMPKL